MQRENLARNFFIDRESVGVFVLQGSEISLKEIGSEYRGDRSLNLILQETEVTHDEPSHEYPKQTVVNLNEDQTDRILEALALKLHGKSFEDLDDEIEDLKDKIEDLNRELEGIADRGSQHIFKREL